MDQRSLKKKKDANTGSYGSQNASTGNKVLKAQASSCHYKEMASDCTR